MSIKINALGILIVLLVLSAIMGIQSVAAERYTIEDKHGLINIAGYLLRPQPPVLEPINNPDGDGDYLVNWNNVPSATSYRLEEDDNPGFTSPTVYNTIVSQQDIIGQPLGTWYYRVLARNNAGEASSWSNTVSVSLIPAPVILPIDNADGNGDYLIDWSDVVEATSYRLEEDDNSGFTSPLVRYEGATNGYHITGQPFGTWYYRVLASNAGGNSPWSAFESVIVNQAPPGNPTLYTIINPDSNGDYTIDWSDVSGAASYHLEEDDNPGFTSPTALYTGAVSQYPVTGHPAGTWYYRVLATNEFGDSIWSNTETVNVLLPAPELLPIDNADGNGDYLTDWSDVPGASSYRLEEADNSDFISSTVSYEGAASQFAITSQQVGTWYYRVRASNAGGNSLWSNTQSVIVYLPPPASPTLLPISNPDSDGNYLVDWTDISGATTYRLEEDDNPDFTSPIVHNGILNSQFPVTGQPIGTWYYRVLASNTGGDSLWSNTESVLVEQGPPASPTLSPIDNLDGDGNYLVDWNDVVGATSYLLEEDDNPSFTTPVSYMGSASFINITNQPAGTWYYRVLASNAGGDSQWSSTESVSVNLTAPTLSPIVNPDGDGNYLVDWNVITGTITYRLEEDDNPDFTSPTIRYEEALSQYDILGQPVGTWYYRVLASNSGGNSPWSNIQSVIVNQGPQDSPTLYPISNPDGDGVYLVDWSVVAGATSYRLEEDDNAGFTSPTTRFEGVDSQYQITGQLAGTWYYRVLASNQLGNGPWSNTEYVSVIPNTPALSPIDNPDNNEHYLIDWSDVLGVTSYHLEEDDNASFSSPAIRYEGTASQYQIVSQPAGTWYYRVLARNAGGDSPWSNVESVSVIPTPPTNKTFLPSVQSAKLYPYGVRVLPASFSYTSHNTLYVIGEVLNNTRDNISSIKVIVNFYNADNHLVGTKYDYLWPLGLPAYDKGCFNFDLDIPIGWSYYRFEISGYTIIGTSQGLNIFDDNGLYNSLNGNYEITGQVRNGGSLRANSVTVSGTLYNAAGMPVGCEHRQLSNPNLNPGQTSSFALNFLGYYRDYQDVIYYKMRVAGNLP